MIPFTNVPSLVGLPCQIWPLGKSQNNTCSTVIFQNNPGPVSQYLNDSILDFTGAKDDGSNDDNWRYKTCKAPVKSSPPADQHPVFTVQVLSCRPTNSVKALKGKVITFHGLAHPKLTWGFSHLLFDHYRLIGTLAEDCQTSHQPSDARTPMHWREWL